MAKEKQQTKICKHCKTEIPYGAKVCPKCRKKQGGVLKWVIIAIVAIGIIGAASEGEKDENTAKVGGVDSNSTNINTDEAIKKDSGEDAKQSTEINKDTEKEENGYKKEFSLQEEKDIFDSSEYLFITNEDLNTYCVNMEGVKIYVVTKIDDIKDDKIQSTLAGGFMMSNFNIGKNFEKYKENLEEDDIIAIFGTVSGKNDYGFMGDSVEINDCMVFAVGEEAEIYKKEKSDSGLSEYLVVTEEVAKGNSDISEDDYKALCNTLEYEDILRNPDSNKGKYCVVKGTVDQIIEGFFGGYTIYVKDSNGDKWKCFYKYKDGESHLLENDYVSFYGECKGTDTSTTVLGKQVTMPDIEVKYIN